MAIIWSKRTHSCLRGGYEHEPTQVVHSSLKPKPQKEAHERHLDHRKAMNFVGNGTVAAVFVQHDKLSQYRGAYEDLGRGCT